MSHYIVETEPVVRVVGPFDSQADAFEWAVEHCEPGSWDSVSEIENPGPKAVSEEDLRDLEDAKVKMHHYLAKWGRVIYEDGKPLVRTMTCGSCGFEWNDDLISTVTPTPAGRCPLEAYHV